MNRGPSEAERKIYAQLLWNQLSRRGIRQLAEACHGRSLATASRPRPIKLQHSFLGLFLAPAFRVQGCAHLVRATAHADAYDTPAVDWKPGAA